MSPLAAVLLSTLALPCLAQAPGQASATAATPPMGWNSWNHFAEKVTDADVRAAADALVSSGMRDAGYIYVNIDDTWEAGRDKHGNIQTNSKFPDMKALADYVHGKGLKLGIYSSPGPKTCANYEGSYKHEKKDAAIYAKWGIDYLKYDMCSYGNIMDKKVGKPNAANAAVRLKMDEAVYQKMHDAIAATGRPIVLSMCQYGWDDVWKWGDSVGGNLWRTTGDITDTYARMSEIGFGQAGLAKYAGPGHWNDPDMLEVGNGGMSQDEYRTHMTLWAMLAAPLLAGNDLSKMTPETLAMLTNKGVIAIDQDALGKQGDRLSQEGQQEIWSRSLSGGGMAFALFNRSADARPVTLPLASASLAAGTKLHDVWADQDVSTDGGQYTVTVPAHGAVLLRSNP
ncbi:glycoside hydrolase family 27 protein [Acidipila sp. EB88]|uniref:glycoside hydrolase family 27 protein n=1 Tax=Acidipila sp. EB88 TaxID=2305226 RepID=UPI000F5E4E65|nr:glycoside hydrolase family 27 protein [Acidipila sp. EB88]RRA50151.1 alpha-galactosidase [Acidipila sp. EB88]